MRMIYVTEQLTGSHLKINETILSFLQSLRKHTHAIYRKVFGCKKQNEKFHWKNFDIFLIFAQNAEAVLTSTHNLCFRAKIRKIGIPLHTPVLLYKSGV